MKPVSYYGKPIQRSYFKGKGLRGWFVLLLHRLWCYLGRRIEWHTMLIVCRAQKFQPEVIEAVKQRFHEEDSEDIKRERHRRSLSVLLGIDGVAGLSVPEEKYTESRKNTPTAPDTLGMLSRLGADPKSKKYGIGRDEYIVQEPHDFSLNGETRLDDMVIEPVPRAKLVQKEK